MDLLDCWLWDVPAGWGGHHYHGPLLPGLQVPEERGEVGHVICGEVYSQVPTVG